MARAGQEAPQPFPAPGGAWRSPATPGKRREIFGVSCRRSAAGDVGSCGPCWRSSSGARSCRRPPGSPGAAFSLRKQRAAPCAGAPISAAREAQERPERARRPRSRSRLLGSWGITGDARETAGDLRRQLQEIRSSGPRWCMCPNRTQQGRQTGGFRRQLRKIRSSGQGAAGDVGSCGPCWRSPARPCSRPCPNRAQRGGGCDVAGSAETGLGDCVPVQRLDRGSLEAHQKLDNILLAFQLQGIFRFTPVRVQLCDGYSVSLQALHAQISAVAPGDFQLRKPFWEVASSSFSAAVKFALFQEIILLGRQRPGRNAAIF